MATKATLSQVIRLEGGETVQRQLKELGEAGERALKELQAAAEKARPATERLARSVDNLKDQMGRLGGAGQQLGRSLATVGTRLGLLGAAAAGAGVALFAVAKAGADAADEVGKAAQSAGLSVEAFQRLEFAAGQAGVEGDRFVQALTKLSSNMAKTAADGTKAGKELQKGFTGGLGPAVERVEEFGVTIRRGIGEIRKGAAATDSALTRNAQTAEGAAAAFVKLNIRTRDANGQLRNVEDVLLDMADRFQRMPDGVEKTALAIAAFGEELGPKLIPFLNQGSAGIRDLFDEFDRSGQGFTKAQAEIAEAMNDSLDLLGRTIRRTRDQFGLLFAPAITSASDALIELMIENRDAILAFGAAIRDRVIPIVRDFINALLGRDADVKNIWILEWRDAFVQFGRDVATVFNKVVVPVWEAVIFIARSVADAINSIFGSNIGPGAVLLTVGLLKLLGVFTLLRSAFGVVVASARTLGAAFGVLVNGTRVLFGALGKLSASAAIRTFFAVLVRGATLFLGLIAGLVGWPALIVAGVVAAGAAVALFWDEITAAAGRAFAFIRDNAGEAWEAVKAGAAGALQFIADVFKGAGDVLGEAWSGITRGADQLWQSIRAGADRAWNGIVEGAAGLWLRLTPAWEQVRAGIGGIWTAIETEASGLWNRVVSVFTGARDRVAAAVSTIAQGVLEAWSGARSEVVDAARAIRDAIDEARQLAGGVDGAGELAQALVAPFREAETQIREIWGGVESFIDDGFDRLGELVEDAAAAVNRAISNILSALRRAAAEAARLRAEASAAPSGSSDTVPALAGGGSVRGPGGPTSDSILPWLSSGEFVVRAKAVDHYGPALFDALNRMKLPPELLRLGRGFAKGGRVKLKDGLPALAMGNLVNDRFTRLIRQLSSGFAGRFLARASGQFGPRGISPDLVGAFAQQPSLPGASFNLTIGGETFQNLFAPQETAERLQIFASQRSLLSLGRRPGWT